MSGGHVSVCRPATAVKTEGSPTGLVIVEFFEGHEEGSTTWPPQLLFLKGLFRDLGSVNENSKGEKCVSCLSLPRASDEKLMDRLG
jgi:hypothetical protein